MHRAVGGYLRSIKNGVISYFWWMLWSGWKQSEFLVFGLPKNAQFWCLVDYTMYSKYSYFRQPYRNTVTVIAAKRKQLQTLINLISPLQLLSLKWIHVPAFSQREEVIAAGWSKQPRCPSPPQGVSKGAWDRPKVEYINLQASSILGRQKRLVNI